ncbi:MAG: N-acetylglucosamine-6-phosphate deacetylase [Oscillospiraceae bacterium]|nr:N-acetylglucosamine-6-phosphate deacetylase [Oscillospiraceae bacterium]
MSVLVIKNARVVFESEVSPLSAVLVKDGKIAETNFKGEIPNGAEVFDAEGGYLLAGFIDTHVHGGGGADFMDCTLSAFETAVKTHLKYGTTTLLPTAMSASEGDLADFLKTFKEFKKNSRYSGITPGVHIEGPYFSGATDKSSGAQPKNILRLPDLQEVDRLLKIADGDILRWDAAPELEGSLDFAKKMRQNGIVCSIAHSAATSEEAQAGIDNGFCHVTHCYNAVTTYHKKDQKVLAGVVEAAYLNPEVNIELICDGRHIPRDVLRLALMIKGAEGVSAITDAMRLAGTDLKSGRLGSLKCGTDVIVDDGVAKLPDLSSFAGSICTSERSLRVLCIDYGIPITDASKMISKAGAKLLSLDKTKGTIEIGKDADLVVADASFTVKNVFLAGKQIL